MVKLMRVWPLVALVIAAGLPAVPGRAAEESAADRLGEPFSSRAAGITFRPPAGGVMSRRAGIGKDIVSYANAEEKWSLKVSQIYFEKPAQLITRTNPAAPPNAPRTDPGILDETVTQLKRQNAAAQILRDDVINIGQHDVGIVISRFGQGGTHWLRQQAFVQANAQRYYVFDLTTPSGHTATDALDAEDPSESMAVGIFRAIIDSVEVLDQRAIELDNNERLFRTRSLLVNLPVRIRKAVLEEQFFRVLRESKDVGWSYQTEEMGQRIGQDGLFVTLLSHGKPDERTSIDVASETFCVLDFKKADEAWVTVNVVTTDGKRQSVTEIGQSNKKTKPIFEQRPSVEPGREAGPQLVRMGETYALTVMQTTAAGTRQIQRDLPVFYLPAGMSNMLARLVPLNESKGYLFGVWVPSEQEVILRYIDVEAARDVTFNGQQIRAIAVKDRVGLEGEPTWHYLLPDGKYLGSITPSTNLTIVSTDIQTITRIWPDAKMARPHLLDSPQEQLGR